MTYLYVLGYSHLFRGMNWEMRGKTHPKNTNLKQLVTIIEELHHTN